jgi:oligopeptidase B
MLPDSRVSNGGAPVPPVARREELVRELHGDRRVDWYAWMRESTAYLAAERSYYDAATRHLRPLVRTLTDEMSSRLPLTDSSISSRRVRFSYYTRTPSGSEYAQLCRAGDQGTDDLPGDWSSDQVILDPAELPAAPSTSTSE